MVKNTRRDKIWVEILQIHRDLPEQVIQPEYDNVAGFTKADIQKRVDADVSKRTINDVVQTAVEHDLIEMVKSPAHASLQEHPITGERTQANVYRLTDDLFSPERTQGEDTQNADEAVSNTGEPDESDSEEHTQPAEAQLEPSQDADEDIDDLPFEKNAGDEVTFQHLPGVGSDRNSDLISAGFESFNDLFLASVEDIAEVHGFGIKTARQVKIYIADMVRKRRKVENRLIHGEYPETIARDFNLDEEAAEKWAAHTHALLDIESFDNPDEIQQRELRYAEEDLLPYLDTDDTITHYPGNPAEA
jgi:hypothetical protein